MRPSPSPRRTPRSVRRRRGAIAAAVLLVLPLAAACGGDGGDAAPDIVADIAPDVPAPPSDTADAVPDSAPDVPVGCPDGTIVVPALDECYPLEGEPDSACAPGDQFVLSFGTDGDFAVDGDGPVSEWADFPGTVTDVRQGQLEVTGRWQRDGQEVDVVARFQWANPTRFSEPWALGQAVQVEWIGAPDPYNELADRHGFKVRDALGTLLYLVDDGKGDLAEPIWTLAPEGDGMAGWTVTREPAGCPVLDEPLGRDTPALPMALRVSNGEAEDLVLPGGAALLPQGGVTYTFQNALAERRVGDDPDQPERMAWQLLGRPPVGPGEAGAICSDALPCDAGLTCVQWPGGGRVCLP